MCGVTMLEGICLRACAHMLEVFEEMGTPPRRFLASDVAPNSALWMQILWHVLANPVQLL